MGKEERKEKKSMQAAKLTASTQEKDTLAQRAMGLLHQSKHFACGAWQKHGNASLVSWCAKAGSGCVAGFQIPSIPTCLNPCVGSGVHGDCSGLTISLLAFLRGLQVCVVHGDCSSLTIGQHVPWDGANLIVMDLFDESG